MFEFKIKSPFQKPSKKHLHRYQAGDLSKIILPRLIIPGKSLRVRYWALIKAGEAVGRTIECLGGNFEVHEWCFYNSDILLTFSEG